MSSVPTRIGPYLIEEKVGAGGMGTVYRGVHAETGCVAAVKVLPASMAQEEGLVARFNREIESLRLLSNPHIVKLYDSGVDGQTYYYAMEYVAGETVADRLRREKRIPWREVIDISTQVCAALKSAHDAGVIHRDLKPSNLLLAPDGRVKLSDFGIAQVFAAGRLTITGGIVGTAEYMSPEQAQGSRATKKSDLYSLGAVMYVMLTGRPPFSGKTLIDIIQKQRYGQFDRPGLIVADIPRWLEDVVCQLLEKDPDKRFPDAYVLSRRLQEIPRKVDLACSDLTEQFQSYDGFAPTVTAARSAAQPGGQAPKMPESGTLMRDLMRVEVEREKLRSPVAKLLDNTWVLVGLLALLVVGGILWFRPRELSPEERFQAGIRLLKAPENADWLRARDEYLLPLVEADPEQWEQKVAPFLKQVDEYELQRAFQPARIRLKHPDPQNEPHRLFMLARQYEQMGDIARAERTLNALCVLLAGDPEQQKLYNLAKAMLDELRENQAEQPDRYALVEAALKRADTLSAADRTDEAQKIWAAIVELYSVDRNAREYVEQAQTRLKEGIPPGP